MPLPYIEQASPVLLRRGVEVKAGFQVHASNGKFSAIIQGNP
jgi:hypothetical protein